MSILTSKPAPSLSSQLAARGESLRTKSESERQASENYLEAAKVAQATAATAARHAAAVDTALNTLIEAGVEL
jgi:hypothetical protein